MPKGSERQLDQHLMLDNENRPADKGRWFRVRDRCRRNSPYSTADSSKSTSFIGTREVAYSDVRIGEPIPDEVLRMDNNCRGARRGTRAPPGGVLGAGAPLQFERKGERHSTQWSTRCSTCRCTATSLHPHNTVIVGYGYEIHRHRSLLQNWPASTSWKASAMQLGGARRRSEPHGARRGLRGLRHARRGREGRRQRRGGLQTATVTRKLTLRHGTT